MYLEVGNLRKKLSLAEDDLVDPFTSWVDILKKIERIYLLKENSNQQFSGWKDLLKPNLLRDSFTNGPNLIENLPLAERYFIVLPGKNPSSKHYVYDISRSALPLLLNIVTDDHCFVVDKKYDWLAYVGIPHKGIYSELKLYSV